MAPIGAPVAAVSVLALSGRPSARYNLLGTVERVLVALVAFSFVLSATDDRVNVPTLADELEYEYSDLLSLCDRISCLFAFATLALLGSLQPASALVPAAFSAAHELTENRLLFLPRHRSLSCSTMETEDRAEGLYT